jgi:hypothetical protein
MKRLYLTVIAFFIWSIALAQNITRVEYFIDTDPGYGNAIDVPVSASPAVNDFSFTVPLTSVDDGFHSLFVRTKDANERWSLVQGRPFVKYTIPVVSMDLSRIEYFVDTDPGYGNGTSVDFEAGSQLTDLSFVVLMDNVGEGFHTLFIRSRDVNNRWSIVQARPFVNMNISSPSLELARIEYFIDTDPGFGSGVAVEFQAESSVNELSFSVSLTNVSNGFHTLSVRAKDINNKWSVLQTRPFVRVDVPATAANITRVEYFVDTDPGYGSGTEVPITPAISIPDLSFQVDMTVLTDGTHMLFVRSKDANDKWSLVYEGDFTVCAGPAPVATAVSLVTTTGFTANWAPVDGVTEYRFDLSVDDFATFVTGYNDKPVNGATSLEVTGLTSDTEYEYRVRAVAANCTSVNSNAMGALTLAAPPAVPVAAAASDVQENSFTANWASAEGADTYLLDVSADNFSTMLPGFDGKEVTLTSQSVAGLDAETQYRYRVRAQNLAGTSIQSNVITVTTALPSAPPSVPIATAASLIAQAGFTANWTAVAGATSYRLDVSSDGFNNFITGYNDKTVAGTSSNVTGLSAGTQYKYRIRSVNGFGPSGSSNEITVTTLLLPPPSAPVATQASDVGLKGFTANWNAVAGVSGYRLDVSSDNFVNFVIGYQDKAVSGTNEIVSGLSQATLYKYRVRAVDANGTSVNSNDIDVVTLAPPSAPVAASASEITATGFTANWEDVANATTYRLDVSTDNFVNFVPTYNNKTVTTTSDVLTGLSPSTSYKYRIRAVGATGTSVNSNEVNVTTLAKQNQTITFAAIDDRNLGDAPITLTAASTSTLDVTFVAANDHVTIAGNIATLVKAGKARITATQEGDDNFMAASPVEQAFCINPPKPNISANDLNSDSPTLISNSPSGNQWLRNGVAMSGKTDAALDVTEAGAYSVQVTIETCASEVSNAYSIVITGDISLVQQIVLAPNPVESELLIQLPASGTKHISIYQLSGITMKSFSSQRREEYVNVKDYASGLYVVKVIGETGTYVGRFVKK